MRSSGILAAVAFMTVASGTAVAQPGEPNAGEPPIVAPPGATCVPAGLTRVVTRQVTPGLDASSPMAQPQVLWRQGWIYMRLEGAQDLARGQQPVVIVAEPDIWMANLLDRTVRHAVDPGPTFETHAPVVGGPGVPPRFAALEYGCEMAFIAANAPVPVRSMGEGAARVDVHVLNEGEHVLAIMVNSRRKQPMMVSYGRGGKPVLVVRYDEYRSGLPDRPQLFQPPAGFKMVREPTKPAPVQPGFQPRIAP